MQDQPSLALQIYESQKPSFSIVKDENLSIEAKTLRSKANGVTILIRNADAIKKGQGSFKGFLQELETRPAKLVFLYVCNQRIQKFLQRKGYHQKPGSSPDFPSFSKVIPCPSGKN